MKTSKHFLKVKSLTQFFVLSLLLAFYSLSANAVSILIGDVDGFGFTSISSIISAQNVVADSNGDGLIEATEYLRI